MSTPEDPLPDKSQPEDTLSTSCPIEKLPDELIAMVLIFGIPSPRRDEYDFADRAGYPIDAESVCRRWRLVALSTSALWAILRITTKGFDGTGLWTRYLEKSRGLPLDILLEDNDHVPETGDDQPIEYTADQTASREQWQGLLRTLAHRIWRLKLDLTSGGSRRLHQAIADLPLEILPHLLEFSAVTTLVPYYPEEREFLLDAPSRLRSLELRNFELDWQDFSETWKNLEELRLIEDEPESDDSHHRPYLDVDELVATLQSSPGLRVLELKSYRLVGRSIGRIPPIVMEHLEFLGLERFPSELYTLLSLVRAPRLKTLRLGNYCNYETNEGDLALVLDFPILETLRLECLELDVGMPIARALGSSVRTLVLDEDGGADLVGPLRDYWRTSAQEISLEHLVIKGTKEELVMTLQDVRRQMPRLREITFNERQRIYPSPADAPWEVVKLW